MEKETINQLSGKLDTIIALLLRLIPQGKEGLPLREQISLLDGLGVRPIDISKIISRPATYVSKELAGIRKKKK